MTPDVLLHLAEPFTGWVVAVVVVFGSYIKTMADRRRAATEAVTAESQASDKQFARLEKEIERLTERVTTLEKAGAVKDTTIAELVALKLEMLAERAAERVLATAATAEKDAIIARLRERLGDTSPLVAATEHVAQATGRVADAAEQAISGGEK